MERIRRRFVNLSLYLSQMIQPCSQMGRRSSGVSTISPFQPMTLPNRFATARVFAGFFVGEFKGEGSV